ncbi:hypothetical protein VZ94_13680 [Methylocucumis oryzae]|uniref:Uncharacterized protein n=2 Tax=Methylocucumis oryzae TaxID=1632867 RepID=A0A0F3IHB5_9GAMM|nr:hypothetical protein VZ94_13680 [Methylocucumis oryzae]
MLFFFRLREDDNKLCQSIRDGIMAESLIFANEDIVDLSIEALIKEVEQSSMNKQNLQITAKQSNSGFTFVNLNFEVLA